MFIELNNAIGQSEESEVAAEANIQAGMKFRSPLANKNVTGAHLLRAKAFYTEALACAIAVVTGCALSFFMGHRFSQRRLTESAYNLISLI